ncbi:hypothetical protein [Mycobacteroides franklinii]|uniref:hypothetical protein n=1 Tax=Mycobacteroides franklinii TaxID=948102 RepID=UPI00177BC273|nr:hypothetical protein [Mycobacteroides franklinii]
MVRHSRVGHSLRSGNLGASMGTVLSCRNSRKWQVVPSSIGRNIADQLKVLDA